MHSAKEGLLHILQCEQHPQELCSIQPAQPNIAAQERKRASQPEDWSER